MYDINNLNNHDQLMCQYVLQANFQDWKLEGNKKLHPTTKHSDTLPETNIARENRPLEKEIPIGNHHFQVLC